MSVLIGRLIAHHEDSFAGMDGGKAPLGQRFAGGDNRWTLPISEYLSHPFIVLEARHTELLVIVKVASVARTQKGEIAVWTLLHADLRGGTVKFQQDQGVGTLHDVEVKQERFVRIFCPLLPTEFAPAISGVDHLPRVSMGPGYDAHSHIAYDGQEEQHTANDICASPVVNGSFEGGVVFLRRP